MLEKELNLQQNKKQTSLFNDVSMENEDHVFDYINLNKKVKDISDKKQKIEL